MAETLLRYQHPVVAEDGTRYEARACGGPMPGGTWQGWIEFVPFSAGEPVRTPRETTQPNRVDTEYWATGVSAVYLEGALRRALTPVTITLPVTPPPLFSGPALTTTGPVESGQANVLNPFSVYEKGEALLRKQLGALSTWYLVNIVLAYDERPGRRGVEQHAATRAHRHHRLRRAQGTGRERAATLEVTRS